MLSSKHDQSGLPGKAPGCTEKGGRVPEVVIPADRGYCLYWWNGDRPEKGNYHWNIQSKDEPSQKDLC